jgi:hypothetical protein
MTPTPSWPDLALYELAQIDRDRYTILAVDLTVDGPVTATVYAIDRIEHGIAVNRDTELGRSRGEVLLCHSISPNRALKSSSGTRSKRSRSGLWRSLSATRSSSPSRLQPGTLSRRTANGPSSGSCPSEPADAFCSRCRRSRVCRRRGCGEDEVFKLLALARVVEPVSRA